MSISGKSILIIIVIVDQLSALSFSMELKYIAETQVIQEPLRWLSHMIKEEVRQEKVSSKL